MKSAKRKRTELAMQQQPDAVKIAIVNLLEEASMISVWQATITKGKR